MCGIAGIFHFKGRGIHNISHITSMIQSMDHRGPDHSSYVEVNSNLVLGHTRLSIIDPSAGAHQPFRFHNDVLVFNGEIYNFKELGRKLQFFEFFEASSDTEVLARGLFHHGIEFVNELRGMFAFAYWQSATQTLWLVRDPMGIKPLYWYNDDQKMVFSSEIRPIAQIVRPEINRKNIGEFLTFQTSLGNNTLLEKISMIPPGTTLSLKRNRGSISHSFHRWQSAYSQPTQPITVDKIRSAVLDSVRDRLVADVPLGAFLSGGVDSSIVVAAMRATSQQTIKTFTVGFSSEEHDERNFARQVSQHFETEHTEIVLSNDDILESIKKSVQTLDYPTGDGVNSYIVSKAVKEAGVTVALSGIGGDELFGGYPSFYRFNQYPQVQWMMKMMPQMVINALPSRLSYKKAQLSKELANAKEVVKISRMVFTPRQLGLLGVPLDQKEFSMEDELKEIRQIGLHELSYYTLPLLLRDTDQMSMRHALEVRVPLLDARLVQLMAKAGNDLLNVQSYSYPKQPFIEAFKSELPEASYKRPKQGFALPMNSWISGPLQELTLNGLFETPLTEYLDKKGVEDIWKEYNAGMHPWSLPWTLSVLGHWLENIQSS